MDQSIEPAVETAALPEIPPPPPRRSYYDHRIVLHQPERIREALAWAESHGMAREFAYSFVRMLSLMASFKEDAEGANRDLYGDVRFDGCQFSFAWGVGSLSPGQSSNAMRREDGTFYMNGGLIFHRPWVDGSPTEAPHYGFDRQQIVALPDYKRAEINPWSTHT